MSYFAEIDENDIVLRVLVGNNDLPNEGYDWFVKNLGGKWIQTSYNATIRKRFASIGFTYNSELDIFISPQPYESWTLDEDTEWQAPEPYPQDEKNYSWNESTLSWVEITGE